MNDCFTSEISVPRYSSNLTVECGTINEAIRFVLPDINPLLLAVDEAITPVDYSVKFTGPVEIYSMDGDVEGLVIDPITGIMSGTPTVIGGYSVQIIASGNSAMQGRSNLFQIDVAIPPVVSVIAKSVVFDIANNHGDGSYIGMYRIEFYLGGIKYSFTPTDYTAYHDSASGGSATNVFNTSLSKLGSLGNGWVDDSSVGGNTNERIIVVFNTEQEFDQIVANNFHHNGGLTTRGSKTIKTTISDDAISDTTYNAAISNSTVLNTADWPEHVSSNVADDQLVWTFATI